MRLFGLTALAVLSACAQPRPLPTAPPAPVDWLFEAPPLDLRGESLSDADLVARILEYPSTLHRVQLTPAQLCAPNVLSALQQRPESLIVAVSDPPHAAQPAPTRGVRWSTVPCASSLSATRLRWSLALVGFAAADLSGLPPGVEELSLDVGPQGVAWVAAQYPQLRVLQLQGNDLQDDSLAPLHTMPALERLDVRWTKVNGEDPSLLPLWRRLRGLHLRRAPHDAPVWQATQLVFLDISEERFVRADDLARLSRLITLVAPKRIVTQDADSNALVEASWESLGALPLRRLTLRGASWAGSRMEGLSLFSQLEWLVLADTWTDDAALACVLPHLSKLQLLDLRDTAITDAALPVLLSMATLSWVDLRDTRVSQAAWQAASRPLWLWSPPRQRDRTKSMPPSLRVSLAFDVAPDRACGLPEIP